jgi:hypothetical protein
MKQGLKNQPDNISDNNVKIQDWSLCIGTGSWGPENLVQGSETIASEKLRNRCTFLLTDIILGSSRCCAVNSGVWAFGKLKGQVTGNFISRRDSIFHRKLNLPLLRFHLQRSAR